MVDIMQLVPSKFFITSGKATSTVSDLNAFDRALHQAGISEQNLVAVSSVIPIGAEKTEITELPMGAVTHCVLSQIRGIGGETVAAGISYTFRKDGKGGYVAEGRLRGSAKDLESELGAKMREMAELRGIEFGEITYVTEELHVPPKTFGCCVAALVFTEYR
ncbi:MAG: pyruvoyl-dependent arginine decarboxylase [Candidatus Methanoplasma sp.]|jgi:arginine decarboxylase|nr:pyruvoyl-dependent arginine decarboxylase [Candidatus Methanoplasma sp.]